MRKICIGKRFLTIGLSAIMRDGIVSVATWGRLSDLGARAAPEAVFDRGGL
jgi:hypothetical protein